MKFVIKPFTTALLVSFLFNACTKDTEKHDPVDNDPTVPQQVSSLRVVNGNGNATISYTLPNDSRLLYVKAVYTITTGQQYEAKASYYNNSLLVEGFADTLEHEVKIISVSRSNVESAPLTVKIKPLISPIFQVYRSIQVVNAFGGYNLTALNVSKANISIIVLKKNAFNEYEADNDKSVFTSTDSISSKIRGLDTLDIRYGFLVKDRWGNHTDTMYKNLKPIYEALLPKSNYSAFALPGDASQVTNGATLPGAWDGRLGWPYTSFTDQNGTGGSGPHMITINIGSLSKISRIYIRPFQEYTGFFFTLSTMKRVAIYGASSPNPSGALDASWTLLGTYTFSKPSGLPNGQESAADVAAGTAGYSVEADITAPKVRYIRIVCLENYAGGTNQSINEMGVYGDPR